MDEKYAFVCLGRKRSQSPSPSRNASPNRSLSPSNSRARDRSVSPLRYINLPISKLARVTEELEHLLTPTASIVHEEDEDEGKNAAPTEAHSETAALVKSEGATLVESVAQEDSFVMPQVPTSILTTPEKDTQSDPLLSQVSAFCPFES